MIRDLRSGQTKKPYFVTTNKLGDIRLSARQKLVSKSISIRVDCGRGLYCIRENPWEVGLL